jgi:hypothetical protein
MALILAIASKMEVLTEAEFLERTLNTRGTREVVYNVDGFDRVETLEHSLYYSKIIVIILLSLLDVTKQER